MRHDHPEYKPSPAPHPVKCATQDHWDDRGMDEYTLEAYTKKYSKFVYLDRVGPELFVGRYHHGVCDAVPEDAAKHTEMDDERGAVKNHYGFVLRKRKDVLAVAARNHAYIVSITPDGPEGRCLYCDATIDGYEGAANSNKAWKEPFDGPRRATKGEAYALGAGYITNEIHTLLYLDMCWPIHTGRFRIGECPKGGPHEAVLCWWKYENDVRQSFCMFCGERWDGPPPGFWEVTEPHNTVRQTLETHAGDARRGRY